MRRMIPGVLGEDPMLAAKVAAGGGAVYEQRWVRCGKGNCGLCRAAEAGEDARRGHGPYWYLSVKTSGGWRRIYVGKVLDTRKYRDQDGNILWRELTLARARREARADARREARARRAREREARGHRAPGRKRGAGRGER